MIARGRAHRFLCVCKLAHAGCWPPTHCGVQTTHHGVTQNDSTAAHTKQLDVVLGVDHMVVIIDDTDAVWPNNKGNLMQIARYAACPSSFPTLLSLGRYLFFPHDAARFAGAPERSHLEQGTDESATEGALQGCLETLRWVHARYYAALGDEV